jgi:hypothetical protein
MLGFELSERTVSRWIMRTLRDPVRAKHWIIFLRNHREAIAAMDFFTVPTITFTALYCFFVIVTIVDESCTSMSRRIRRALGSFSSCAKHFPWKPLTNT